MRKLAWLMAIPVALSAIYSCQKEINSNPALTSEAKPATKTTLLAPTLTSLVQTQSTIEITVTASSTGAPAGFSIQWISQEQLDALGGVWPASDDPSLCKASFSGKANGYNYALRPGQSITLTFGDLLADFVDGASVTGSIECLQSMMCGTQYAFRVFAHGDNANNKSPFSYANFSTLDCSDLCGNKHWTGYWKSHTEDWPQDVKDNGLTIGGIHYDATELETILNTAAGGNGYFILSHQLIATELNVANGATYTGTGISDADSYLSGVDLLPETGTVSSTKNNTWNNLSKALHEFNTTCN